MTINVVMLPVGVKFHIEIKYKIITMQNAGNE